MKKTTVNEQRIPLFDIHESSYLEYKGIELTLTRQGTRVVFEVPATEQVYSLLREYQENPLIPLLDYVVHLRRLRARMLEMRDGNDQRKWGKEDGNRYAKT